MTGKGNEMSFTHCVELIGDFHQLLVHLHTDVFALQKRKTGDGSVGNHDGHI